MNIEELNYEFFNQCTSLSDAARKLFNRANYRDGEKIKILANNYGFDWHIWQDRRKKKKITISCLNCGKNFTCDDSKRKFCSQSCAASFNNSKRTIQNENDFCLYCGKKLVRKYKAAKFCSSQCQNNKLQEDYIKDWKQGKENGIIGKYGISQRIRNYLFNKYQCKCQLCGWGIENQITHKVPLQIHHIDGNCLNNKEENLQLLCPNCHSLTDTFGNLNEHSNRIFRKQKGNI